MSHIPRFFFCSKFSYVTIARYPLQLVKPVQIRQNRLRQQGASKIDHIWKNEQDLRKFLYRSRTVAEWTPKTLPTTLRFATIYIYIYSQLGNRCVLPIPTGGQRRLRDLERVSGERATIGQIEVETLSRWWT